MEEQFQRYLSRKRELLNSRAETSPEDDTECDGTISNGDMKRRNFNPTPPPILIGGAVNACYHQLTHQNQILSKNHGETVLSKISKIPNTQLEKETAKIKMKYHIRRLRIARRRINAHAKSVDVHEIPNLAG